MVERLPGTIRERNKTMSGLDNEDSSQIIVDEIRIYYNFIRPHMGLNGKTTAQQSKLNLQLKENKWLSLIRALVPRILISDSQELNTTNFKSLSSH